MRVRGVISRAALIGSIGLAAAMLVALPSPASAQAPGAGGQVGAFTVTPFLGGGFGGDLNGSSMAVGVAGAYNWTPRVSFEGEFSALPTGQEGVLTSFDTNAWDLTANALYHFTRRTVRTTDRTLTPYAAVGLGLGHASADLATSPSVLQAAGLSDSSTSFVFDFGGGVKYPIAPRVNLRGDLRYFTGGDIVPNNLRLYFGVGLALGQR